MSSKDSDTLFDFLSEGLQIPLPLEGRWPRDSWGWGREGEV